MRLICSDYTDALPVVSPRKQGRCPFMQSRTRAMEMGQRSIVCGNSIPQYKQQLRNIKLTLKQALDPFSSYLAYLNEIPQPQQLVVDRIGETRASKPMQPRRWPIRSKQYKRRNYIYIGNIKVAVSHNGGMLPTRKYKQTARQFTLDLIPGRHFFFFLQINY